MTPALLPPDRPPALSDGSTVSEAAGLTIEAPVLATAAVAVEACLVHIYPLGPTAGCRYPLGAAPAVIGRGSDCAVRNPDASVSRCHARVVRGEDGHFRVSDLGSRNGTFVNNVCRREGFLWNGDYLRVGNCIYRFLAGAEVETAYREEIYRLTIQDGLTQTYNGRYFTEFLERELDRTARFRRPLAVLLLDIDDFRAVNDRLGYLAGDMALRELCARVRTVLRSGELLARRGGEEFAIVLPEADADTARVAAERLRLLVAKRPFAFHTFPYLLTVSVGAAVVPPGEVPTAAALLNLAEMNLARAKQAGRNRVVLS
jgi:diguanylate cyclase (GGDEF)-like protein